MHIETLERRQLFAFGDFDPTFGTGGRAVIPFERGDADFQRGARDVLVLADGRIATISEKELALYKPNGTLDPSFGGGSGFVKIDFGGRLAQAGDGDLLILNEIHAGLRVHSLRLDGSVDSSFGQNGVFSYSPGAFIDSPMEFELDAQG